MRPLPTPIRTPLHVDWRTHPEIATSSHGAFTFFRREGFARTVMQSSSVETEHPLTTAREHESMSMPSLLCPRGSFFIDSPDAKTSEQPWKKQVQNGAFESRTFRTDTPRHSQKNSICPGRHRGYANFRGNFTETFSGTCIQKSRPLPSISPPPKTETFSASSATSKCAPEARSDSIAAFCGQKSSRL